MKEIKGNLWDYLRPMFLLGITTNGTVKTNGACVMGRGCAFEASQRYPEVPKILGQHIREHGNVCWASRELPLFFFPVKHNWYEMADLELIRRSAEELAEIARHPAKPIYTFVLPRPGCGNGRLRWEDVRGVIAPILPDNVWVISF